MKCVSTENPIAFGVGPHVCLGAPHARLLLRTLIRKCVDRIAGITLLDARERVENEAVYQRVAGFESLTVRLAPLPRPPLTNKVA